MIEQTQVAQKISVRTPEGEYPIFLGKGLLDLTPRPPLLLGEGEFSARCAIITNPRVGALYASRVTDSLRANNFQPSVIEIPDGEQFKTLDTVRAIYDQLIDAQLDRGSIIFALGGGVVGDIAGFVAATFLRGVPLVQLPTTLLAMVDSSIGGKVGVDHPRGKNLIGAFKQPLAVIADTDTLATLPEEEFRCGMAEVVKHGMIGDAQLFRDLETAKRPRSEAEVTAKRPRSEAEVTAKRPRSEAEVTAKRPRSEAEGMRDWRSGIGDWLPRAIRVKVDIVERDPFEQGPRAKLNLGHTFGHALEKVSGYEMRHGEAVAIGLACATRLSARRGLCDANFVARVENLLRAIGLPTRVPREFLTDAILDAMQTDKKRVDARLRFVLPRALGDVVIAGDVTQRDVTAAIEENRD
jgi:3-dehydroquinate synthase